MCIQVLPEKMVVKVGQQLQLWKLIRPDNHIGIWSETYHSQSTFQLGINVAEDFEVATDPFNENYKFMPAQFHCFFTRKAARKYVEHRADGGYVRAKQPTKIIKVYANSKDVVSIGYDRESGITAISVSKIEIKSLKHQR